MDGALYAQNWATIASDDTTSHLYIRGAGNPQSNSVDVDIPVTGVLQDNLIRIFLLLELMVESLWTVEHTMLP